MRRVADIIPDADVLCALEPEELGLRLLPLLAEWEPGRGLRRIYQESNLGVDAFIQATLGTPTQPSGQDAQQCRDDVELAIREAWAWLEGVALLVRHPRFREPNAVRLLSRQAQRLAIEPNPRRALSMRRLVKDALYPAIRDDVWSLYHREKFDTAIFEAMKAVEVAVRAAAQKPNTLLGVKLMQEAFSPAPNPGPLTDASQDGGEQVARMSLFAGAVGSYKNPQSHRHVAIDDPDEAAEIIMLANHLLRIVDARRLAIGVP